MSLLERDSIANKVLKESCTDIIHLVNVDEIALQLYAMRKLTLDDFSKIQNIHGHLTEEKRKYLLYFNALAGKGRPGLDAFLKALDKSVVHYYPHEILADKLRAKLKTYDNASGSTGQREFVWQISKVCGICCHEYISLRLEIQNLPNSILQKIIV